ncbi:lysophospholipid acyltransferase family protein [Kiloniella sp. b19]|uniref:lysophospholipid acyltransferase family protein n=1 Tax=Kiloniella sp. GXU_MW_B19 TaxID=3141326 RepID=UPI0031D29738
MVSPLILLRSTVFNIFFLLWCLIYFLAILPLVLASWKTMMKAGSLWARGTFFLLRIICGIKLEVRGRENLPKDGKSYLVASKHESAAETINLLMILETPCFVLKKELLKLPLFGWFLQCGKVIAIDRSAGAKALKMMVEDAKDRMQTGRPIIIFPEGTRTAVGQRQDFQPGVAALATGTGLTTIPTALNSGLFWGKNAFVKRPGTMVVEFLPALPDGLRRKEYMPLLEETINTASDRLTEEALKADPGLIRVVEESRARGASGSSGEAQ